MADEQKKATSLPLSERAATETFAGELFCALRAGPLAGIPFCLVTLKLTRPTGLCSHTTLPAHEHRAKMQMWAQRIIAGGDAESGFNGRQFGDDPLASAVRRAVLVLHPMLNDARHGACLVLGTIDSYATIDASGCPDLSQVSRAVLALVAHAEEQARSGLN